MEFGNRYADVRDIDEFVDALERFERGEMDPDEFKGFRLARGVYGQRQPDVQMVRVKIPQGILTADQLEKLGHFTETWSRGSGHVTTRQNIQAHFVRMENVEAVKRDLAEVGLTTREACGNTVRNVTACPHAGVCGRAAFDVTPYGQAITRHFLRNPICQKLPRKFKISLSGCEHDCNFAAIHDIGLIAKVRGENGKEIRGFEFRAAGALSTTPEDAHVLHDFLPVDELLPACEAMVRFFDRAGNRKNPMRARMKYVWRKLGKKAFVEKYEKEREAIRASGRERIPIEVPPEAAAVPEGLPAAPTSGDPTAPDFLEWRRTNVRPQRQEGYFYAIVRLHRGDITSAQFRALAGIVGAFGDGSCRTTIDQNLVIRWLPEASLAALHARLAEAGLGESGAREITDITACPGADTCNLAYTGSRELASVLRERLEGESRGKNAAAVEAAKKMKIKISGCPNSCGQHHIANIGFHGGMRRVGKRAMPVYQLHVGGGVDRKGATFGRQLIKVPASRCAEALVRLIGLYHEKKTEEESVGDYFKRVTKEEVEACLRDLIDISEKTAREGDFCDLGTDKPFEVQLGEGECMS